MRRTTSSRVTGTGWSREGLRMWNNWGGVLLSLGLVLPAAAVSEEEDLAFFESKIRPLLAERCYESFSPGEQGEGWIAAGFPGRSAEGG